MKFLAHQPTSIKSSRDQHLIETIGPSSRKRRKLSLSKILIQISFYVIDLVNFNPYQFHCYGNQTLKGYIPMLPATCTTFSCHKIFNSTKFLQNGKPIRLCNFQIYCNYYIMSHNLFKQPCILTLGVTVQNTIKSTEFHLSVISGSKFKILSQ